MEWYARKDEREKKIVICFEDWQENRPNEDVLFNENSIKIGDVLCEMSYCGIPGYRIGNHPEEFDFPCSGWFPEKLSIELKNGEKIEIKVE